MMSPWGLAILSGMTEASFQAKRPPVLPSGGRFNWQRSAL